jgi:surface polysaccharide O-acyltransferase-like enzyme
MMDVLPWLLFAVYGIVLNTLSRGIETRLTLRDYFCDVLIALCGTYGTLIYSTTSLTGQYMYGTGIQAWG